MSKQIIHEVLDLELLSLKEKGLYAFLYVRTDIKELTPENISSYLKEDTKGVSTALRKLKSIGLIKAKYVEETGRLKLTLNRDKIQLPTQGGLF